MKKWFLLLLVLGISTLAFSQDNTKQVIGKWKYTVDTGSELWTGVFKFVENEGKITGELATSEGTTLPFSKIEFNEENMLNLELKTDNDIIKISVKVNGNKFSGTGASSGGEASISGEKVVEP
jgi:carbonic anhydrase